MGVELYSCTISFDPGITCIFSPSLLQLSLHPGFWHLNDGENDHYNLSLQLDNSHGFPHGPYNFTNTNPLNPKIEWRSESGLLLPLSAKKQLGPGST